ncbi:hypothetical protein ABBQ38_009929 [Trebouxia sp. C0009 RCD-2024]
MTQNKSRLPGELPLLPLHNQVLLPGAFARVHFKHTGRNSGLLLEHLLAQQGERVFAAAVPVHGNDTDRQEDLSPEAEDSDTVKSKEVAAAARVLQVTRSTQTGAWVVMLEGWCRIYVKSTLEEGQQQHCLMVNIEQIGPSKEARYKPVGLDKEGCELAEALHLGAARVAEVLNQSLGTGKPLADMIQKLSPPAAADMLASILSRDTAFKQLVLEAVDNNERMRLVVGLLEQTLQSFKPGSKDDDGASQKQLVIRPGTLPPGPSYRGLKPMPSPGGAPDEEEEGELSALMAKLHAAKPPEEVMKVANREHRWLKKSSDHHPGYAIARAYLETLADLPWNHFSGQAVPRPLGTTHSEHTSEDSETEAAKLRAKQGELPEPAPPLQEPGPVRSAEQLSLAEARALLDKDHYGLDKVKDRIVQYLAVRRLKGSGARAPILCFVGPPGTGKTSLASSISKVLQRPFQRVSVGGVRDEAEIRGHRRTYVGAMPGRIIQALRRSGVRDPVLLLDEVDKMSHDSLRGDPASALLEVLDPNQNQAFVDTYLSLPFDLSQVVFVATANQLQNMSGPLLDRLEIIQLSGYTLEEKRHIAERHLIPGLLAEHGLTPGQLAFPSDAVTLIADGYTREAGVRSLSRHLAAMCRHVAVQIVSQQDQAHAQLHEEQQDSSDTVLGQHSQEVHHSSLSLAHAQQQQQQQHQQHSDAAPEDVPCFCDQAPQMSGTGLGVSALDIGSDMTGSAGQVFWGGLWGGLKGAFTPSRQHHKRGFHASRHLAQAATCPDHSHMHPPDLQMSYAANAAHGRAAAISDAQQSRQRHTIKVIPSALHTAGGQGLRTSMDKSCTTSVDEGQQASNPYGGVNSDMVNPAHGEAQVLTVTAELIEEVLGPRKYNETDSADSLVAPGSAAGLVWTAVGGQVQYVECCCTSTGQPHRPGKLVLTGQAGEVLQESAHLALSWIRSHTHQLGAAAAAATTTASSQPEAAQQTAQTSGHPAGEDAVSQDGSTRLQTYSTRQYQTAGAVLMSEAVPAQPRQVAAGHNGQCAPGYGEAATARLGDQAAAVHLPDTAGPAHFSDGPQLLLSCDPTAPQPACLASLAGSTGTGLSHTAPQDAAEQTDVATAAAQWDVHIHLPAGAVPKDGPSAGITLATAMVSLFLGRSVRADTAMTGELTLRGLVLPIGGLKEKLLAAHHAGIKRVLVPRRNWRDIQAEIPANIKASIDIIPVHVLEDVLQQAFAPPLHLRPGAKL